MDEKTLEFAIFCIESVAEKLKIDSKEVYKMLKHETSILSTYIVPCYDSLHTQSKEYIVSDIIDVMVKRGVVI